jgi:predicted amidohydrolase
VRLGLIQLRIADGESEKNLARAVELVRSAPRRDLILLPELFTTGYGHDTWRDTAAKHTPVAVKQLSALAAEMKTAIAGSMISLNDNGKLVNRLWLLLPDKRMLHYDKTHLFAPMRERELLCAGADSLVEDVGEFRAAFSICFDLRFPEAYRNAAISGANLFCIVSEWPTPRAEALRILARARAIENHAYVALCNRVGGANDGTEFGGGSAIIAPDGAVLADAGSQPEAVVSAELDANACRKLREAIGTF